MRVCHLCLGLEMCGSNAMVANIGIMPPPSSVAFAKGLLLGVNAVR